MEARLISIAEVTDERGSLHFIDLQKQLPFTIGNVFYIRDVPEGAMRGGHANANSHELIIAVKGSFRATVNKRETFTLDNPSQGLLLPSGNWIDMDQFSEHAVVLVLSSAPYDPEEKITQFSE